MYQGVLLEFFNIGGSEMMIIVLAILLLFGGKKLPELARGLGKGIREFKDASEGVKREIQRNINAVTADEETNTNAYTGNNYHHPVEDPHTPSMNENEQAPETTDEGTTDEETAKEQPSVK